MSNFVISLLVTIGAATWVYAKLQRSSGNNTKQSLIVSTIAGAFLFIIVLVLIGAVSN